MANDQSSEVHKGHCPDCGPSRAADVVGEHRTSWDDREAQMWGSKHWRILRCRGCDTVYVQTVETFSEDTRHWQNADGDWHEELDEKVAHWPAPAKRTEPEWSIKLSSFDRVLGSLFEDVYGAINAELSVPSAIAMRTVFDRASDVLGVDAALSFDKKLDELVGMGKISTDERETLSALIDAGSAAVHRGWRPRANEIELMVLLMEAFVHRTFVLGDAAKELKKNIPPKPPRVKKNKKNK